MAFYLPEGENPLLGSHAAALDHDEVLLDLSVVGEATHRVDGLVGQVVIGRSVVLDQLQEKSEVLKNVQSKPNNGLSLNGPVATWKWLQILSHLIGIKNLDMPT